MSLFSGPLVVELFSPIARYAHAIAHATPDVALLATAPATLAARIIEGVSIEALRLHIDRAEQLSGDAGGDPLERLRKARRLTPNSRDASLSVVVPFSGHPLLLHVTPRSRPRHPLNGWVDDRELVLSVPAGGTSASELARALQTQLDLAAAYINCVNADLANFTRDLRADVTTSLTDRLRQVRSRRELDGAFGLPPVRPPPAPVHRVRLTKYVRKEPSSTPPAVSDDTAALDLADYEEVVAGVAGLLRQFERMPGTFAPLGETAIRDYIILHLNQVYNGSAGAEQFNGAGKTDILLRLRDRNVFIAECKVWDGTAKFSAAVDQVLSYVTWRDALAAIVLIVRAKDATAVIDKAATAMAAHPKFLRAVPASPDPMGSQSVVMHAEGDRAREVRITLLPLVLREKR